MEDIKLWGILLFLITAGFLAAMVYYGVPLRVY